MKTGWVMSGSGLVNAMVWTPESGMLKAMMLVPKAESACRMASWSEPAPLDSVLVTVKVSALADWTARMPRRRRWLRDSALVAHRPDKASGCPTYLQQREQFIFYKTSSKKSQQKKCD